MTKKVMFLHIAQLLSDNAEVVEFCNHQIEMLSSRKPSKSMTKTQKANIEVMENIKAALANVGSAVTVTELIASSDALAGLTNQKVSALLRKLVNEKVVTKTIEGKKARFSLV